MRFHPRVACACIVIALVCALTTECRAADRHWQRGTWTLVDVTRQMVDFGPGSGGFGPQGRSGAMRALAEVRIYEIETTDLRLEFRDLGPIGRRTLDAVVGQPVMFAVEKDTIWVRGNGTTEHKLRLSRKTPKNQAP